LSGGRRRPTTEAPKDDAEEGKDDTASTVAPSDAEIKPGRKRFGGPSGPRRGLKRTTTPTPASGSSETTTASAPKKPLPTRGTAGGLFGKGQGIRGPRPRPGRRPVKKQPEEPAETNEEKEKSAQEETPKTEAPTAKSEETKVDEGNDSEPTEGPSTTAGPVRARQRQRGALFAGGRPRPNLRRPTASSDS
ncbi:hypothetical protein BIW11_11086, partial [Tropilaelaps mercedesae]